MNNDTHLAILDDVYTKKQADKLVQNIDSLIASLYSKGRNLQKIQAVFSLEFSERIIEMMRKEKISINDNDACQKFFESLREKILNIDTIELTVAFDLALAQVQKIAHWINNNSERKLFLDIKVNPKIIGGLQIGLNGMYKDKSLKTKISKTAISL